MSSTDGRWDEAWLLPVGVLWAFGALLIFVARKLRHPGEFELPSVLVEDLAGTGTVRTGNT